MKRALKTLSLLMALALAACALSSCHDETEYPPELPASTATPPPYSEEAASFTAELFFVSEDGRKLYVEERELSYEYGSTRAYAAVEGLMAGPISPSLTRSVPEGLNLEHVEASLDVCNVYLTGIFPDDIREWLTARVAIAATVCSAGGFQSANIFYNGTEPGYNGKPLGEAAPISEALDVYLGNMQQVYEVLPSEEASEAGLYETHAATLYFANSLGELIVARSSEITYPAGAAPEDLVYILMNTLRAGDSGEGSFEPVLPADFAFAAAPGFAYYIDEAPMPTPSPTPESTPGGTPQPNETAPAYEPPVPQGEERRYILDISVSSNEEYDEQLMAAALTMTFTGYIPGLDGVRISVSGGEGMRVLQEPYFTRQDFRSMIGNGVALVYPDADGLTLREVTRIVQYESTYSARARLEALFAGPADPGVMHEGPGAEDILEVYVAEDIAVVNWRAGFAEKLRAMIDGEEARLPKERREIAFIYGVINTLAELPYVKRVWMLENGERLGSIKNIYLGGPLVPSPGLISEE